MGIQLVHDLFIIGHQRCATCGLAMENKKNVASEFRVKVRNVLSVHRHDKSLLR